MLKITLKILGIYHCILELLYISYTYHCVHIHVRLPTVIALNYHHPTM